MSVNIDPTLPLIDLHRHINGSVRLATILDLADQFRIKLPGATLEKLRPHVQIMERQPGVMAFISKMLWMTAVLGDVNACRRIAREDVEDAKREGIDYIELRSSPVFMAEPHKLDLESVTAAVVDGAAEGSEATGVKVNLIGIISRTYGTESGKRNSARFSPSVIGSSRSTSPVMRQRIRQNFLSSISRKAATQAGISRSTPARAPGRKVSGTRFDC